MAKIKQEREKKIEKSKSLPSEKEYCCSKCTQSKSQKVYVAHEVQSKMVLISNEFNVIYGEGRRVFLTVITHVFR